MKHLELLAGTSIGGGVGTYLSIDKSRNCDVWTEKPVTAKEVLETLSKNVASTKNLLTFLIDEIPKSRKCSCEKALYEAEF